MDNEKISIPPENLLPVVVNMLADIVAWQEVQIDLNADQMAMVLNQPTDQCKAALVNKKDRYLVEKVKIPADNPLPAVVNMLTNIISWQQVQLDLVAMQEEAATKRPLEQCFAILADKKDKYRVQLVESIWEHYGPDFGSELQKS